MPFPSVSGIYDLPECVPSSRRQYLGESFQLKQCSRRPPKQPQAVIGNAIHQSGLDMSACLLVHSSSIQWKGRPDLTMQSIQFSYHAKTTLCSCAPRKTIASMHGLNNSTVCLGRPPGIVEGRWPQPGKELLNARISRKLCLARWSTAEA